MAGWVCGMMCLGLRHRPVTTEYMTRNPEISKSENATGKIRKKQVEGILFFLFWLVKIIFRGLLCFMIISCRSHVVLYPSQTWMACFPYQAEVGK